MIAHGNLPYPIRGIVNVARRVLFSRADELGLSSHSFTGGNGFGRAVPAHISTNPYFRSMSNQLAGLIASGGAKCQEVERRRYSAAQPIRAKVLMKHHDKGRARDRIEVAAYRAIQDSAR